MRMFDCVIKEIRQMRRDRRLLFMLFGMPIVQLMLYGYAVTQDIRHLRVVFCDMDQSSYSRNLIRSVQASPEYFDTVAFVGTQAEVQQYLDSGLASLALVIPKNFGDDIVAGRTGTAQALVDGSDPNAGTTSVSYLGKIVIAQASQILDDRLKKMGMENVLGAGVDARIHFWYNPTLQSSFALVPGVICMIAGNLTMFLSALAVVRERELGTIEQLLVTPLQSWELMLGKLLPFLMMGFVNIAVTLTLSQMLFGIPMRGSAPLFFFAGTLFMFGTLGLGLLISTASQTQQQASMLASLILMPNMMLSGFMYPIANMPNWLQPITYFMPMRYFLTCARGIMMKGNGFSDLSGEIWPMALLSSAIFVAAVLRFQRKLD